MNTKNTGGPAFPFSGLTPEGPTVYTDNEGMTLRDYFAAQAMKAFISSHTDGMSEFATLERVSLRNVVAKISYVMADAMLAERDK